MMTIQEILMRRTIPVVVNVFNQLTYTKYTVETLRSFGFGNILIVDQLSQYDPCRDYLNRIHQQGHATVINLPGNYGPHWLFTSGFYECLSSPFIYTDPDLSYPDEIDDAFCLKLHAATKTYKVAKAGCALDISRPDLLHDRTFFSHGQHWSIAEWESRFWENELESNVFSALVDTTFHLFNKDFYDQAKFFEGVRIAGPGFTLKHMPWYKESIVPVEEQAFYAANTKLDFYVA